MTDENINELYKDILRRIPREHPERVSLLGLSYEESNAAKWAQDYYLQLSGEKLEVTPEQTNDSLEDLCAKLQKLIPPVTPEGATNEFMEFYNNKKEDKENWGRTFNYFNRKMKEVLPGPLTYAPEIEGYLELGPIQEPIDLEMLDQLAKEIYVKTG